MPDPKSALYVADCPRCGDSRTTFDVLADIWVGKNGARNRFEAFLCCRSCEKPSIALVEDSSVGSSAPSSNPGAYVHKIYQFKGWVFKIPGSRQAPDHVPSEIERIFQEAANCAAIGAWDAAGSMFRKVLDAATRTKTPKPDSGQEPAPPNWKTYKDLRLRLDWLFENGRLDRSLEELSSCIHQDGNDAAHDLVGIGREEAEDVADFAERVLEVIYTLPGQIEENKRRREERRAR